MNAKVVPGCTIVAHGVRTVGDAATEPGWEPSTVSRVYGEREVGVAGV